MTIQPPFGTYSPGFIGHALIWLARATLFGRGQSRMLIHKLLQGMYEKSIDTTFLGAPMRLDPRKNPFELRALLKPDRLETEEREIMHRYLTKSNAVFVDIGANMGLFTFDALLKGNNGIRVVSIEPQPNVFERLHFNVETMAQKGFFKRNDVSLYQLAVASDVGVANLSMNGEEHLASLVPNESEESIQVETRPLLTILNDAKVDHIDCLKIDIEGYEGQALGPFFREAPDTLLPNCILIEHQGFKNWSEDLFSLMTELGYHEIARTQCNAAWVR